MQLISVNLFCASMVIGAAAVANVLCTNIAYSGPKYKFEGAHVTLIAEEGGATYTVEPQLDLTVTAFTNLPQEQLPLVLVKHYRAAEAFYRAKADEALKNGNVNDAIAHSWRNHVIYSYFIDVDRSEDCKTSPPKAFKKLIDRLQVVLKSSPDTKLTAVLQEAFGSAFVEDLGKMYASGNK